MLIVFIWGLFVARDAILDIKHYSFHIRALEQNNNKKTENGSPPDEKYIWLFLN